jgi:endonuclease/exonuclease/phosphatase family metal-dependent hydrolase
VLLGGEHLSKSRNRQIFGKKSERPSVFLPAWGIVSVIALVYFLIGSPTVIARWTEGNYSIIIAVQILIIAVFGFHSLLFSNLDSSLAKPILIFWNFLFLAVLAVFVLRLQFSFPDQANLYPIYAEKPGLEIRIMLYVILLLSPVLFVDLSVFTAQVIRTSVSITRVGLGFFAAALVLLCLIFFHIFTTVYDYIPLIGPFFRNKFWLVHLLVVLGLIIPIVFSRDELIRERGIHFSTRDRLLLLVVFAGVIGLNLTAIPGVFPKPSNVPSQPSLKVMTYNVQQGYSKQGVKNYLEQLQVIKQVDPDIIGLQETDSVRIAGGNSDLVRYFADRLQMHSYYGPTPVTGTFGIALLSKYPILNPQTFFMYSIGEQTAAIEAQVQIGSSLINICVTHLGNDGDMVQQQAILNRLQGKSRVVLLGDFNFGPDSPQYQLTTRTLVDSWLAKWPGGVEDSGLNPESSEYGRIDHIFTTSDLKPLDSRFLFGDESDHPALFTDLSMF